MLRLAEDLRLPLEGVTESLGFLGRKGSGKSYTGNKLAEEMYRNKVQFVAIDPVGISSRDAYLARLKARGLIAFASRGMVRASPELFD